MKRQLGLAAVAATLLVVGVALAQPRQPLAAAPQQPSALDRLTDLERKVGQLQAQVDLLRKAQVGEVVATDVGQEDLQKQMEEVLKYLDAQAKSAAKLQAVLEESRVKGFTYGINPDSRIVLLSGFNQFVTTLQTDVPKADEPAKAEDKTAANR